jgi:hypothetical protein
MVPVQNQSLLLALPNDALRHALGFLDGQSKVVARFTCKRFCTLIPNNKKERINFCAKVAARGDLKVLKWAKANGAPWNELVCALAIKNRHLQVLKWARENGAPWNYRNACKEARLKDPKMFQWVIENDVSSCD